MNAHALRGGGLTAVSSTRLLLMAAAPASAHVTVNPAAEPGSYAKLTFRVPNERPDSATVKLDGSARALGGLALAAGLLGIPLGFLARGTARSSQS